MTLSRWEREIAQSIPNFQLKRVRSGVETALAAAGASREIRGQLQSHTLRCAGASDNRHDYINEKIAELANLDDPLLAAPSARKTAKAKAE